MNIAIDIGHARRTGASGNGLQEHEVCARLAVRLKSYLEEVPQVGRVDIIDFPERSNTDDLYTTVNVINEGGYELAVSLHCDCSDNPAAKGAHVIHWPDSDRGEKLATCIATPLAQLMPGRANITVARKNLFIISKTVPPTVLCECGFISNPDDSKMQKNRPEAIALCIAEGVKNYLTLRTASGNEDL